MYKAIVFAGTTEGYQISADITDQISTDQCRSDQH